MLAVIRYKSSSVLYIVFPGSRVHCSHVNIEAYRCKVLFACQISWLKFALGQCMGNVKATFHRYDTMMFFSVWETWTGIVPSCDAFPQKQVKSLPRPTYINLSYYIVFKDLMTQTHCNWICSVSSARVGDGSSKIVKSSMICEHVPDQYNRFSLNSSVSFDVFYDR